MMIRHGYVVVVSLSRQVQVIHRYSSVGAWHHHHQLSSTTINHHVTTQPSFFHHEGTLLPDSAPNCAALLGYMELRMPSSAANPYLVTWQLVALA